MKIANLLIIIGGAVMGAVALSIASCNTDINSIGDSHFDKDGAPLDTLNFFTPTRPSSVKLYVETSGSMNGFFRANQSNKFKKTVWSVFTGLQHLTDNNIYPLSNGGKIDSPVSFTTFRTTMNGGGFVSSSETHIPMMLVNIIANIDPNEEEVALLVSDMKYSPMGKDAAPNIAQYQEQIRNLAARHNYATAFVCAESEFFGNNGYIVEENSPYYYIIIGNPENVAAIRNDIVTWCEATGSYIDSGDLGMHYKNPPYTLLNINNGVASDSYPNNVITSFSRNISDTCSFIIRVDLTGYPCGFQSELLDSCFNVTTSNGAGVIKEIIDVKDDHHVGGQFERKAYADYLIKVFNMPLDDEIVEWTFNNRPLDGHYSQKFNYIIDGKAENELDRSFSFNKFIEGYYNARFNEYDLEPGKENQYEPRHVRILISHNY